MATIASPSGPPQYHRATTALFTATTALSTRLHAYFFSFEPTVAAASSTPSIASARLPQPGQRLPYIDDKTLQAVQARDKFVDFNRLLPRSKPESSNTTCKISEGAATLSSTRPSVPITTPAQWCRAFSIFASYHTFCFPHLSQGLLSYLTFMTGKLNAYPLQPCLDYDAEFRRQMSRYPKDMSWESPNHDIMGLTFNKCSTQPGIDSVSHSKKEARKSNTNQEICKKFNVNACSSSKCPRIHKCFICKQPHSGADHYRLASTNQPGKPKNFQQKKW